VLEDIAKAAQVGIEAVGACSRDYDLVEGGVMYYGVVTR
jgi:hypothetical protein